MTVFSERLITENVQVFWEAMQQGEFINDAARAAGTYRKKGSRWLVATGGVRPRRGRDLKGRCLSFGEREQIALGLAANESLRWIGKRIGRSPSTISREVARNRDRDGHYLATSAHARAYDRASRPKPAKLATNQLLRHHVEADLKKRYSPEQISGRLRAQFPSDLSMRVSTETIYRSLYLKSHHALDRELSAGLRTGRKLRRPSRKVGQRKNRIPGMVNIDQRHDEVKDRGTCGHWEGDLIIGKRNLSAIATLVERKTGYTMLVHLPDGYPPEQVKTALSAKLNTLPPRLRKSLTWDQGPEMRDWQYVTSKTGTDIYFCDAHSPWQRGTNENTNGLLRQYFPKGSDLSRHSAADLEHVAAELNDRPRKRHGYLKPVELLPLQ